MKRYWKTLLISFVSVMVIGFYYIQVAIAAKGDFTFKIETTSGNEAEIDNISLAAYYQRAFYQRQLNISKDGSNSINVNRSQIDYMFGQELPKIVKEYIEEHRQFMRGKQYYEENYFKDEDYLVYAAIQDFDQVRPGDLLTVEVDVLELKTNERSSFEIQTPAQESYNWMGVRDVFMQDGKIKIVATGSLVNSGEELRIFTVDEKSKVLQEDKLIVKVASEAGIVTNLYLHTNSNESLNDNYYLYEIKKYKKMEYGGPSNEYLSHQLYVYNKLKNEVEEIVIPAEIKPKMTFLYGAQVFMPTYSADGIELNHYSIETQQWEEPLHYDYTITVNKEEPPLVQLMDEKLYIVNRVAGEHLLYIGDLRTGESLYEGKITAEHNELSSNGKLHIASVLKNN
ncbi:hypothetical protein CSE16_14075 [Solibacillus sp. R5-41]|uniref:hypothetical protein n=1 Tax=Solibacillus sp. R5-41 TaxID=2048654 RepID=UPI000C126263|nr:hypothetical protein [Solibacillus sp. R5-41]ATP41089.1 hypothetical protein CSE16_14075 [Solibacillus sp. R5-41]